jgi:hypothetical protein
MRHRTQKFKCQICQKEFIPCYCPDGKLTTYCGWKCAGISRRGKTAWNKGKKCWWTLEKHGRWKGGKFVGTRGIIYIKVENHPHKTKQGYVLEHILVMEKHLGRLLRVNEVIHHLNHNPSDNRIENLKLMTKSSHGSLHGKEFSPKRGYIG